MVFRDQDKIRAGQLWLTVLEKAVGASGSFVVLFGQDGVRRWIGAETKVVLNRYFGPYDDTERLPIFLVPFGGTPPEALPAFLALFQSTHWDGSDPLPFSLLDEIAERRIGMRAADAFEGCSFVGLDSYGSNQAQLFFCRQM